MSVLGKASLVSAALALLAVPALFPPTAAEPLTHEQALAALRDARDPEARRAAVQALGDAGTTVDTPALVAALRDDDAIVRATAESSLWRVWSRSGDPAIDRLFVEGVAEMEGQQLRRAVATFTRIIELRPDFAEAWNKRATVYYLLGELDRSLADCDQVMTRNPYHFGALSGYGLIYIQLDRPERALEYLQRALAINPNLQQVRGAVERIERELRERGREIT